MPGNFLDKSNGVFRHIITLIVAVFGVLLFLFFKIYQKAYLYTSILIHKIETACGCTQMTQLFSMHPFIFGAIVVLSVLIIAFIVYAIFKLVKLVLQTRKFSDQYLANAKSKHSAKLRQIIFDLGLEKNSIIEIEDSRPVVFCFGLWKTMVCISSGLINLLEKDELKAVLLHEDSHLVAKEPLRLFIIKFFFSIFFFLPGIKTYLNKYITYSELAADERATNNFTDKSKLTKAIFKITQEEERNMLRSGLALSFFTSTIDERVNKL